MANRLAGGPTSILNFICRQGLGRDDGRKKGRSKGGARKGGSYVRRGFLSGEKGMMGLHRQTRASASKRLAACEAGPKAEMQAGGLGD